MEHKGLIDLVTEVDIECEKIVTEAIAKKYPDHGILSEEGTELKNRSDYLWIVDPLDGTTNFAHGFPMFCVSIALVNEGKRIIGVAYDALRDELFTAVKGSGAFLNGKRIKVSDVTNMDNALLATGFPYDIRTNMDNNVAEFNRVVVNCQAIRRAGSAVIDLCYTACGRFDGFWEKSLFAWDMAAGALILEEAGGVVTDMNGDALNLYGKTIAAANRKIHPALLKVLKE
ncbi:MAG: inositol monophosphatase family protein [Nitrospinota bacterium]